MKTVFHIIDKHVCPALRRKLVIHLYRRGLTVSEISRLTGYSKSLVSRYLRGERGAGIDISLYPDIDEHLSRLAHRIVDNKLDPLKVEACIARIAVYMMRKRYVCGYHKTIDPGVNPAECNLCPEISREIQIPAIPGTKE